MEDKEEPGALVSSLAYRLRVSAAAGGPLSSATSPHRSHGRPTARGGRACCSARDALSPRMCRCMPGTHSRASKVLSPGRSLGERGPPLTARRLSMRSAGSLPVTSTGIWYPPVLMLQPLGSHVSGGTMKPDLASSTTEFLFRVHSQQPTPCDQVIFPLCTVRFLEETRAMISS
jgi:hypothetical protein